MRFRHGVDGAATDLLLVAWLTNQDWLPHVPRAVRSGPNATQYEYATFPSQHVSGSSLLYLVIQPYYPYVRSTTLQEASCDTRAAL